jgi:hypothetical protein
MSITNLKLKLGEFFLPCPFCASITIELRNTHTASYWMECGDCGAQVHGEARGENLQSHKIPVRLHEDAAATALRAWNTRYGHVICEPAFWSMKARRKKGPKP